MTKQIDHAVEAGDGPEFRITDEMIDAGARVLERHFEWKERDWYQMSLEFQRQLLSEIYTNMSDVMRAT